MHVQLSNDLLTMIPQHLQKGQLMCIHLLSISTALIAILTKSPVTHSYDYSEQSSKVSESELGYSEPDRRER